MSKIESYTKTEIFETKRMIEEQGLDVRTITMGINILDCIDTSLEKTNEKIDNKIFSLAENLSDVATSIEEDYGIPIINRRITITPISLLLGSFKSVQKISIKDIQAFNDPLFHKYNSEFY